MFQLQFSLDGYWNGQPGLVTTPEDDLRSSATSPQAGRAEPEPDRIVRSRQTEQSEAGRQAAVASPLEIPDT